MNQSKVKQLKLIKDQNEDELESASLDDLFVKKEPGPGDKIQMEPDKEKKKDENKSS